MLPVGGTGGTGGGAIISYEPGTETGVPPGMADVVPGVFDSGGGLTGAGPGKPFGGKPVPAPAGVKFGALL
jgi:hypothetical protein